ncbi:MAG: hypothetical protein KDB03_10635 [Planctomycetales bacterium]|nr:hypothetical protein [Planctomycetales bacterium]
MTLERAIFQKSYLVRYLVVAAACLGFAAWFAYDGFVGYPRQLAPAQAYEKLRDLSAEDRQEQWRTVADENNWPRRAPKSVEEIRDDIKGQYFWALINVAIGIPALIYYARSRGSWIESTEQGLTTSWGQSLDFSTVSQLDKRKWRDKGIAKAHFTREGSSHVFVFDDFKYDREPLGKMLRRLENQLSREQIVGGPTEEETDAETKKQATQDSAAS